MPQRKTRDVKGLPPSCLIEHISLPLIVVKTDMNNGGTMGSLKFKREQLSGFVKGSRIKHGKT